MLTDAIWVVLVVGLGVALLVGLRGRWTREESNVLWAALGVHTFMLASTVLITTYWYGYGDMFMYHHLGSDLAANVRSDPRMFQEVVLLILHLDPESAEVQTAGAATTGAMIAFTSVCCLFTNDSIWGAAALFTMGGFIGKILIFEALRMAVPAGPRSLAIGALLVPSAVFWTSGIIKESVATAGLGMLFYGTTVILERRRFGLGAIGLLLGTTVIYSVKPYILVAGVLASVAYAVVRRQAGTGTQIRPFSWAAGAVVAVGAWFLIGLLVPRVAMDNLLDETSRMQEAGYRSPGGSSYTLSRSTSSGLSAQLAVAPFALFTGLFRPGLWESTNALMLFNAIETSIFLVSTVWAAFNLRFTGLLRALNRTPVISFLLVFVFFLALGAGATSSNLGTLSRYRMPIMPFFAALLFLLHRGDRTR